MTISYDNTTTTIATKSAGKHLSKFFACLIGTTAICLSAYTLIVDSLVQSSEVPMTYKWFLLKEVPGPRIIFESGSNSHHAIDTDALGKELGMTAINIADNGGYALEDKITRLESYARPDDIVILPLEWTFYHREKLTDNYVETLFTDNRDYYRSMPVVKRVKRALSLPPEKVIAEIFKKKSRPIQETESPGKELFVAALTQSTGHASRKNSSGPGLGVAEQSCDDYILGKEPQRRSLKLGTNVKPALARLQKLQARGIDIHFAWPVLAGEGCMSDPAYVKGFRTEIQQAVTHAGFEFLGTPSQSLYGQEVQDDSPYHVTTQGTDSHTRKMIDFLKAQGYGVTGTPLDIKTYARHRLLELELAETAAIKQSALPVGQTIAMDDPNFRSHVEFTAGWWAFESYGRWMRDNRAMFRVTLPNNLSQDSILKIQGITKSGYPERVNVSVNGQLISSGMFGESAPLLVPVANLPQGEALSIFLTLPEAAIPQSPLELGENEDARSMTLHLQNLTLETLTTSMAANSTNDAIVATPDDTFSQAKSALSTTEDPQNCAPAGGVKNSTLTPVGFSQGWWSQEPAGRWMKGREADFDVALPAFGYGLATKRYTLTLEGEFFMSQTQIVSIKIDGKRIKPLEIAEDGKISVSFESLPKQRDVKISLRLSGKSINSPKALGLSQDERTLTYFLKSVQLTEA